MDALTRSTANRNYRRSHDVRLIRTAFVFATWSVALPVLAQPTPSAAPNTEARALFDKARTAIEKGDVNQACELFEQSQKLDPSIGTEFYLGDCYERQGKKRQAAERFRHVAELASQVGAAEHRTHAIERAQKVEANLLQLTLRGAPSDAQILVDGAVFAPNRPTYLDEGAHSVTVSRSGFVPFSTTVAGRGAVELDLSAAATQPATVPSAGTASGVPASPIMPIGIATLAIGGAGLIVGGAFGVHALVVYGDSDTECDASNACSDIGLELRRDAADSAALSNGFLIAGGITAAAGIVTMIIGATLGDEPSAVATRNGSLSISF
jgi:hypothetical protein